MSTLEHYGVNHHGRPTSRHDRMALAWAARFYATDDPGNPADTGREHGPHTYLETVARAAAARRPWQTRGEAVEYAFALDVEAPPAIAQTQPTRGEILDALDRCAQLEAR